MIVLAHKNMLQNLIKITAVILGCLFVNCSSNNFSREKVELVVLPSITPTPKLVVLPSITPTPSGISLPSLSETERSGNQINFAGKKNKIYAEINEKEQSFGLNSIDKSVVSNKEIEIRFWSGFSVFGTKGLIIKEKGNSLYVSYIENNKKVKKLTNKQSTLIKELIYNKKINSINDISNRNFYNPNPDSSFLVIEGNIDGKIFSKIYPKIAVNSAKSSELEFDICLAINICKDISSIVNADLGCQCK